ncbi:MAG: hypothetical protein GKS05_05580 [Nitrospirales bacterium]|nr:hypothetical protein [Nitrospirales bacterium]
MHELQLMQQVVHMVDDIARKQGHGKPTTIRLQISSHSHLAEHSLEELQATWHMAAFGTAAQDTQLETEMVTNTGLCQTCGFTAERRRDTMICPTCESGYLVWEDQPEVVLQEIEWLEEPV